MVASKERLEELLRRARAERAEFERQLDGLKSSTLHAQHRGAADPEHEDVTAHLIGGLLSRIALHDRIIVEFEKQLGLPHPELKD